MGGHSGEGNMFKLVIRRDSVGYYTWRLEGPPIRGNPVVLAEAPQWWAYKDLVLEQVKIVKSNTFTAIIEDNTPAK